MKYFLSMLLMTGWLGDRRPVDLVEGGVMGGRRGVTVTAEFCDTSPADLACFDFEPRVGGCASEGWTVAGSPDCDCASGSCPIGDGDSTDSLFMDATDGSDSVNVVNHWGAGIPATNCLRFKMKLLASPATTQSVLLLTAVGGGGTYPQILINKSDKPLIACGLGGGSNRDTLSAMTIGQEYAYAIEWTDGTGVATVWRDGAPDGDCDSAAALEPRGIFMQNGFSIQYVIDEIEFEGGTGACP